MCHKAPKAQHTLHCAVQVPLRTFFALDQRLPTDVAAVRMGAANATDFGFIDVHMYPSELHRLRNINFAALWAGNDVVNVRWNGAVWNHLVLNDHLWPVSERYGLQKLSKRQARCQKQAHQSASLVSLRTHAWWLLQQHVNLMPGPCSA